MKLFTVLVLVMFVFSFIQLPFEKVFLQEPVHHDAFNIDRLYRDKDSFIQNQKRYPSMKYKRIRSAEV